MNAVLRRVLRLSRASWLWFQVGVLIPWFGCSLQNFDSLGSGTEGLNMGGSSGAGGQGLGGGAGQPVSPNGLGGANGQGAMGGVSGAGGASGQGGRSGTRGGSGGSDSITDGGAPTNLIANSSFEAGHVGWLAFGDSEILDLEDQPHTGTHCIASTSRVATWEGPAHSIQSLVSADAHYSVAAWARVVADSQTVALSLKTVCEGETAEYTRVASVSVTSEWTSLGGEFSAPTCALSELSIYFEGPAVGVDFFVDDVSLYAVP